MANSMKMKSHRSTFYRALLVMGLLCPASTTAQDGGATKASAAGTAANTVDSLTGTSPCFEGQGSESGRQRERSKIAGLPDFARFWLTEDVIYLISREERCTFLKLATDEERSQFIEQFWSRRAPYPRSLENTFKQAHYERIAFADEKYGTQIPGWKTDRGRVYVTFGPPDSVELHRAGDKTGRPPKDGIDTYQYSWERWYYRHLEGVGENLELEFVDPSESGDYHLAMPSEMKDELTFAPKYNLGGSSRGAVTPESAHSIELYVGPAPTPLVQFKDLEAMVVSRIVRDQLRVTHRIEFARATEATTLARILFYLPCEQTSSSSNNGDSSTEFEVFGRISRP